MKIDEILHGDCFDLFKNLEAKSVDYVFTSPPYNRKRNDVYDYYDDTISDYYSFMLRVIEECRRVARKSVFLNIQTNYYNRPDIYRLIGTYADFIQNIVVWGKTNPVPARHGVLCNAYELFLIISEDSVHVYDDPTKNLILTSVNNETIKGHSAVMKYEVADWFIKRFTTPESLILDPFMGTGTTAVACIKNGRHYIGFEKAREYFDISNARIHSTLREQTEVDCAIS